jgi:hypothetical protein
LTVWDQRLSDIWQGRPVDLFDLALADTVKAYPTLSVKPFKDMILGMIMDVPGLGQVRNPPCYHLLLNPAVSCRLCGSRNLRA